MKVVNHHAAKTLDWAHYEAKAKKMTDAELRYARLDAFQAAQAMRPAETEGLYMDEVSVYAREQDRRGKEMV